MHYQQKNSKSNELNTDYKLAKDLAQAIGLADYPPASVKHVPFISNIVQKKEKKRKLNSSDLLHLERQRNSRRVRQRNKLIEQQERAERQKSIRKNSVKDVFVNYEKPQENPFVYAKTQQIIIRNDIARAHKYQKQSKQLKRMSDDKTRRSKILTNMLNDFGDQGEANVNQDSNISKERKFLARNSFYNPLFFFSRKAKSRPQSVDKLAQSFDFSRFNLISRNGELHLNSKCQQRRIQTAKSGHRSVRLKLNEYDKFQMQYSRKFSESSSFVNN